MLGRPLDSTLMPSVTVLVLAPMAGGAAGPLALALDAARTALAGYHGAAFKAAGADRIITHREPPDDTPFGARLRRLLGDLGTDAMAGGLIVLGATAIPLATPADRLALVTAARGQTPAALVNQRHSADVLAIACAAAALRDLPDLETDNALPRWLAETGVPVGDLSGRRRLAMDIDSPLDLVLLEHARRRPPLAPIPDHLGAAVRDRLRALERVAADPGAELLVAGRTSAADLRWLESRTRSRTRALVEERGLRAASAGRLLGRPNRRPPRTALGLLLDRAGAAALGELAASLSDAALIDTRVLLAHRLGADQRGWPSPEDRYASDLLLPDRIVDPWLRELTSAATAAPIPIMLGGHSLVGPGLRLALRPHPAGAARPVRREPRGAP